MASGSTAAGSATGSAPGPWRVRSACGNWCTAWPVVTVCWNSQRRAPGTENSCSQKGRLPRWGCAPKAMAVVMVGPTRRPSRAVDSSAPGWADWGRRCTAAMLSPLQEKRSPSRGESGSPVSRDRSRISVLPKVPAARMTWRACSSSGPASRACRSCRVCSTSSVQRGFASRSCASLSRLTLAPVNSCAPASTAWRSRFTSSESLAPTLQPVMQSPHRVQACSFTPAALGLAVMATVTGTSCMGRCRPASVLRARALARGSRACSGCRAMVFRRPGNSPPRAVRARGYQPACCSSRTCVAK